MSLIANAFFDVETFSFSYVLVDPDSRSCAIVDPVLNYDRASATSATRGAQQIVDFVICNALRFDSADERTGNIHVHERISRDEYIALRTARDHDLAAPKLLDAALPFNMAGGLIAVESLRECCKRAAA